MFDDSIIYSDIKIVWKFPSNSVRRSLHVTVSHTLNVGPHHHEVGLAGLIPGDHLGGEVFVHVAVSHHVGGVADYLGSEILYQGL